LVEAIRRAGPKVSRKTLVTSLENLGAYDLGGYVIEFQPGSRLGSRFVELSLINKNGKLTR
jgi:branched-chain amino acid transport system substrate-binding protein